MQSRMSWGRTRFRRARQARQAPGEAQADGGLTQESCLGATALKAAETFYQRHKDFAFADLARLQPVPTTGPTHGHPNDSPSELIS